MKNKYINEIKELNLKNIKIYKENEELLKNNNELKIEKEKLNKDIINLKEENKKYLNISLKYENKKKEYQKIIDNLNKKLKENENIINNNNIKPLQFLKLSITNFENKYISSINKSKIELNDKELLKQKIVNLQLELNRQINKNEKLIKYNNNKIYKHKYEIDINENKNYNNSDSNYYNINFNSDNNNTEKNLIKINNNILNNNKIKDIENKYNQELKEKDEEIEYLNNEIIELKTQLEEIEITKCNISTKEKEYEDIINDYEAKIKFLKDRNNYLLKNNNNKFELNEYEIICNQKYDELQWFLLINKKMKNIKNKNYEDYIWVDKMHINELSLVDSFRNNISNDNKCSFKNKIQSKNILPDKINRNKDFSFSEQNSNF